MDTGNTGDYHAPKTLHEHAKRDPSVIGEGKNQSAEGAGGLGIIRGN